MEIKNVLEPPIRSKEITQKQTRTLRLMMQKLQLPAKQQILYNLATKQSKSGFFSNERLFILNTKDKQFFYLSKVPEGLIPFRDQEEVRSLKFKEKISRSNIVKAEVQDFKCNPIKGKLSTLQIKYKKANEENVWALTFGNNKLMNDWVDSINRVLTRDQPRPKTPEKPVVVPKQIPKTQPVPIPKQPQPIQVGKPITDNPITESKKIINQTVNNPPPQPLQHNPNNSQLSQNQEGSSIRPNQVIIKNSLNVENNNPPANQQPYNESHASQSIEESKIVNLPYSDHVSQLRYLRKQKPSLFNTTNELSNPKIVPAEQKYSYNQINKNQSSKSKGSLPKREYHQPINSSRAQSFIKDSKAESHFHISGIQNSNFDSEPKLSRNLEKEMFNKNINTSEPIADSTQKSRRGFGREQESIIFKAPEEPRLDIRDQYNLTTSKLEIQKLPSIKINSLSNSRNRFSGQITHHRQEKQLAKQHSSNYLNIPLVSRTYSSKNRVQSGDDAERPQRSSQSHFKQQNPNLKNVQSLQKGLRELQTQKISRPVQNNFVSGKGSSVGSRRTYNRKKWNQIFAETSNKLDVYEQFVHTSHNIVREIVNELPMDKNKKQYLPIEIKPPLFTYYDEGIIIILHYFQNSQSLTGNSANSQDAPLLYDQSTYQLLKRQFYNFNLILSATSNEGFIKVPLCAYFQYKGVIALCKAQIPEMFTEVSPKKYQKQFDIIQNQIHVRFMYGSFNSFVHPNSKYLIVDNMRELIPQIPVFNKQQHFFRKQFLLGFQQIIEDLQTCNQAHQHLISQVLPQFLGKLQSLESYVVNSNDLQRICHDSGLSLAYLPFLIQQAKSPYLKRIFITELVSIIFVYIFRSEVNHLFAYFPLESVAQVSIESINAVILQSCHSLIEMMFGYSNAAESIWKIIVEQCNLKYRVTVSKEDIIAGYLFGSIIQRMGLACDFRRSTFNKHNVEFFVKAGNIPRDLFIGFKVKIRRYDLSTISPLVRDVEEILYSQPNPTNFKIIVDLLNLRQQSIPAFLEPLQPLILTYLCNFVPYSEHEQFQHIGIYNMVVLQPHSFYSTKLSLLAVKWCIKKRLSEEAYKIYEMKQIENAFWLGQYNPAISQFYDFFSMYNASIGKYDESIQLAKLSLKNIIKVLGVNQLPVADKHYQLGNIYFKMGRKEQSIKEYTRTKEILVYHNQVHIAEYAIILLKLAVLYLNFGRITQCVNNSLQALKIFDKTQDNQQNTIGTFQILARCYEIAKKNSELTNISDLVAEKFNFTEDIQIFQRMTKIVLYNRLKNMSSAESKAFVSIISKLQSQNSASNPIEAFTFLHKKSAAQILMKKATNYMDNIVSLYEQASKKDLFRRYKSLDPNTRTQAEEMLVIFDALGLLVGYGYMMGSLKDSFE